MKLSSNLRLIEPKSTISRRVIHLGIVCPMANEENCVERFTAEVLSYCEGFRAVSFFPVLDRVSNDKTLDLLSKISARDPRIKVIWAPSNRCVVDAYVRGYQEALLADCDWILEIDAGYSHQPFDMPKFFEKMEMGYDCVFGTRFSQDGAIKNSSIVRYFISRAGGLLTNFLLGTRLSDMTSGFEAFTSDALQHVLRQKINSKGHFFQTEIKTYCRNLKIAEVPIYYRSASPSVTWKVIKDAMKNLLRLFISRMRGELKGGK